MSYYVDFDCQLTLLRVEDSILSPRQVTVLLSSQWKGFSASLRSDGTLWFSYCYSRCPLLAILDQLVPLLQHWGYRLAGQIAWRGENFDDVGLVKFDDQGQYWVTHGTPMDYFTDVSDLELVS